MNLKKVNLFLILYFFTFVFSNDILAATIHQLKNSKVLIDNDDDEVLIGQEYYVVDSNKKNTGSIIKVISTRGEKSVAIILRGHVLPQQMLVAKTTPKIETEEAFDTNDSEKKNSITADNSQDLATEDMAENNEGFENSEQQPYRYYSKKMGLLFNMMFNSMNAKESDGTSPTPNIEDVGMAGVSIGLTGTLDFPIKPWLEIRASAGYEPFIVSNTASIQGCDNTTSRNCNSNITYLAAGGYGRFNLYQKKFLNFWSALGFNLRYPITKSSTAVRTADLNLTSSYGIAAGCEYFISFKEFIPFSIEQQFFKSSDTVKASLVSFRVGYGLAY